MGKHIDGIIYTFLYVLLCKIFVGLFGKKREKISDGASWITIIVLIVLEYAVSVVFTKYSIVKQLIVILLASIGMRICFKIGIIKSCLIVLLYQGICFVSDYLAWIGLQKLLVRNFSNTIMLELFMGIVSQMFIFCIITILRHHFEFEDVDSLTNVEWVKISIFPLVTIVEIIAIVVNFDGLTNERQINTLLYIALSMLFLNIFVFYLLRDAIEREVKTRKERLYLERAKTETEMYKKISENLNQQKKREHEYKNEMVLIATLLKQNELKKLKLYISKYTDEIEHQLDAIDTNNVTINAILNVKYAEARKKNIVFVFKVNDLSGVKLDDQDIVVILSNMLNNAIEACERCNGKRLIKLKAINEHGRCILSVINTIEEKPKIVNGRYQTTKKNLHFHGIGIENIEESVKRSGGTCVIRYDDEYFYFVVYMPEQEKNATINSI